MDRLNPRETVLLRVLLRLADVPHAKCHAFLSSPFGKALVSIEVEFLRKFAVRQLSKCCGDKTGVTVGADEIMTLKSDTDPINIVTDAVSELGLVAKKCAKIAKKLCHVFVTSLKEAPLFTASGTAVLHWTPEPPDEKATEIILQPYPVGTRTMEEAKPLLIASAGFHFSSMVFCSSNPWSVFHPVCARDPWQSPRKRERVSDALITDIKNFIVVECKGIDASKEEVEDYLDHRQALPHALICGSFGLMTKGVDGNHKVDICHSLFNLLNCEFAFVQDAKQLEQFGESYDLFRAKLNLPVLSAKVEVHLASNTAQRREEWFRDLVHQSGLTLATDSLFEMVGNKPQKSRTLRSRNFAVKGETL